MSKALVFGAKGLIGSWTVEKLTQMGHEVVGTDRDSLDLIDKDKTAKFVEEVKPEVVFFYAANAAEGKSQFSPIDITQQNIGIFMNTIVPCINAGVKRFVYTSSVAVYGAIQLPFRESDSPSPQDIYGINKLACEGALRVLAKVHDFEFVIVRPHNCYDDKTEVLTDNGFKLFKDLNKDDLIATLNQEVGNLEYHGAYAWQKISYKGDLYNFKSKSHDLMVTPDHKLLIKKTPRGKWIFETASEIEKSKTSYSSRLKCFSGWDGEIRATHTIPELKDVLGRSMKNGHQNGWEKKIPMRLWCQFLGWYISEGCRFKTKMNYVISISQYKLVNKENRQEIIKLIKQMGFIPYIVGDKEVRIFSKQLYKELDRLNIGKSFGKNIPKEFKNLDTYFLQHLFDSLMKGDGDKDGGRYTTNSKQLADDFCELCLKLGKSTTVSMDVNCWRISITNKRTPQLGDNYTKKIHLKRVPYNGFVYDVTVPNHIIYVRRNGKSCWSSNCYGPRQNMTDPYRNVITLFMNSLMKGQPYSIYGDGSMKRCFSYVEDVVDVITRCGFEDVAGMTVNIGSSKSFTINELSDMVQEVSGIHIKPTYIPDRPQEVHIAESDHTLCKKVFKYKDTPLAVGLLKTWNWAKQQGPQELIYTGFEISSRKIPSNWK